MPQPEVAPEVFEAMKHYPRIIGNPRRQVTRFGREAGHEVPYSQTMKTIQFSLGRYNTDKNVDGVLAKFGEGIENL